LCFAKIHDENHRLYLIYGGSPEAFDAMDDNWLYFFGGRPMLIRPMFSHGTCTGATSNTYDRDSLYNSWRTGQLERFAVGKTVAEIVAVEGPPNGPEHPLPQPKHRLKPKLENLDGSPLKLKRGERALTYQFGDRPETLKIKAGRCISVSPGGLVAVTLGASFWEHQIYQATFRMPEANAENEGLTADAKVKVKESLVH
jgi:hypothetical protein